MKVNTVDRFPYSQEANRSDYGYGNAEQQKPQPRVATKPGSRELRCACTQLHRGNLQEQVEALQQESEGHYGNCGAHPGEEGSLVGGMIAIALDHGWRASGCPTHLEGGNPDSLGRRSQGPKHGNQKKSSA